MYYVITKGDYEDYHILAVTTDREKAEKMAMLYSDEDEANIEEFPEIDEAVLELRQFYIVIDGSGNVTSVFDFTEGGHKPESVKRYRNNEALIITNAKTEEEAVERAIKLRNNA